MGDLTSPSPETMESPRWSRVDVALDGSASKATDLFARTLSDAFDQYRDVWKSYLALLKRYEDLQMKFSVVESQLNELTRSKHKFMGENDLKKNACPACAHVPVDSLARMGGNMKEEIASKSDKFDDVMTELNCSNIPQWHNLPIEKVGSHIPSSPILCNPLKRRKSGLSGETKSLDGDNENVPKEELDSSTAGSFSSASKSAQASTVLKAVENTLLSLRTKRSPKEQSCNTSTKLSFSKYHCISDMVLTGKKRLKQSKLIFQPMEPKTDLSLPDVSHRDSSMKDKNKYVHEITLDGTQDICDKTSAKKQPETMFCPGSDNEATCDDIVDVSLITTALPSRTKHKLMLKTNATRKRIDSNDSVSDKNLFDDNTIGTNFKPNAESTQLKSVFATNSVRQEKPFRLYSDTSKKKKSRLNNDPFKISNLVSEEVPSKFDNCTDTKMPFDKVLQESNNRASVRRDLNDSFNIIPEKISKIPYAHKSKPVRNKAERAKLAGNSCWECEKYYNDMGLDPDELQARKNQCSRHREKFQERCNTPTDFWNPVFSDTLQSTFQN
ncbi:uncharacterized protein LOC105700148 [Orussus abietinus]|uniref:uncharacterized protein LOC105700148 n=1 Tax=Orussus abietinus TaxID=222816 RepID=UPI000625A8B1|nr:uncharacterized protein LOC105700148 [Orussus abietinus]